MAAYDIQFRDPGGEYYFSKGPTAAGVWTGGAASASIVNSAAAGRATTYALSGNLTLTRNVGNFSSWIVGFAFYIISLPLSGSAAMLAFKDTGTVQCDLRLNATGQFLFTRNGTQIGSTSAVVFNPNVWTYIEVKAIVASGTSGSMELRINGSVVLTVTGVNTQATANAFANQVSFFSPNNATQYWKDMYIMADTGAGPYTTYLGDVTVVVSFPNAAGTNQQWTNNGGASQTASVQDGITHTGSWPDDDTTYISDNTVGHISDFAHQTLVLTGQIYEVCHVSYMRKDDAGARGVAQVTIESAVVAETSSTIFLGNTYQYYFDSMELDPGTSLQWTVANYNAATFGVKTIS